MASSGEIRNRRTCPACGSLYWKKTADRGLTIISEGGNKKRRLDNAGDMPWYFYCLKCGYEDNSYD